MTLTQKRINTLFRGVSSTIAGLREGVSPKRVHRLRTTIRRIQSAIDYAQPGLGRKQQDALDNLSKLRKRAGKVRDLDVQRKLLGAIANGSTAADRRLLKEVLETGRSRHAHRLFAMAQNLGRAKFAAQLSRLRAAVQASVVTTSQSDGPLEHAQKQIARLARHSGSQAHPTPRELHKVRIALKMVRYLAELAEESEEQQALLQKLKSVQDTLGDWHDWEELSRTAEKQFSARANSPILGEIRALFTARQAAARSSVSHFFLQHLSAARRKPPRSVAARALAQRTS